MEFRLIYKGRLHAAGGSNRAKEKQAIRRALHPQLRDLWKKHPALQGFRENDHVMNAHLADNYARFGCRYIPMINGYFNLTCALDILFLRREAPGDAIHGGDLDNRLKVLFDGLRLPGSTDELAGDVPLAEDDPFYCLLEDDRLIEQFQVTTDRLLTPLADAESDNDVLLVIRVETRSMRPGEVGKIL